MKKLITVLTLLLTFSVTAQDEYVQNDTNTFEAEAKKITSTYNKQLALTSKQVLLFQKKVQEFLIRKADIERKYNGKEKLDLIYGLQQNETAEMGDILTQPQMELYKQMKPTVQPLDRIKM